MIQLITPLGMLFTVALMVIYSTYALLIGVIENSWVLLASGGLAIVASYGAALLRPWSQYLVYLLAAGFTAKFGYSIYSGVVSGYFGVQFSSLGESLWSLVPGIVIVALSLVSCALVYRHFHRAERPQGTINPKERRGA